MQFRVTQQFTLDCTQMLETTAEKRRLFVCLFVFESHVIRVYVWDLPLRPRQTNCVRARTMVWRSRTAVKIKREGYTLIFSLITVFLIFSLLEILA
ncbi:hypothetical protein C0J52_09971 [Blattella germanica]|nr:hypothetical protein C0J52_09971 [Blattella germanica]